MPLTKLQGQLIDSTTNLTANNITVSGTFVPPTGNTASRPLNSGVGTLYYNTERDVLENYTSQGWLKVSIPIPTISSISGTIYSNNTSTLTLTGSNFGSGQGIVTFTSGGTIATANATPASSQSLSVLTPASIYGLSVGTLVNITFTNSDGGLSGAIASTIIGLPTGGTITQSGNTRIHSFTSSNTFVVPTGFSANANYLVVAGGGGGARYGGGGGAGGLISSYSNISSGSYSVTVGGGGAGWVGDSQSGGNASNGSNSTGFGQTSIGGGGAGTYGNPSGSSGASGGSGGGGAVSGVSSTTSGGSGTSGQGNSGGGASGTYSSTNGGGGGGAGGSGASGNSTGQGGPGVQFSVTGSYYGGGGSGSQTSSNRSGGIGGGGTGFTSGIAGTTDIDATINTGGGGGGGRDNSVSGTSRAGNGGSGIVIISYQLS